MPKLICHPALIVLACLLLQASASCATNKMEAPFYAFCVGEGGGIGPQSLADEARMLRELGFDGEGKPLWLGDELSANLQALDEAGMPPYLLWTTINLDPAKGAPYDPKVPAAIQKLAGRPTTLCVVMKGLGPGDTNGLAAGVKALRELGDLAAKAGVRISIYNHANTWAESVAFNVRVVRMANHPQVGFNFNVCHWDKLEAGKDYRPLLRANADKLFCVTICGSDTNAATWVNGLTQPLDRGNFDSRVLLSFLDEIGYRGPIGLMCYGIPGDAREHLARSMKVWRSWHRVP